MRDDISGMFSQISELHYWTLEPNTAWEKLKWMNTIVTNSAVYITNTVPCSRTSLTAASKYTKNTGSVACLNDMYSVRYTNEYNAPWLSVVNWRGVGAPNLFTRSLVRFIDRGGSPSIYTETTFVGLTSNFPFGRIIHCISTILEYIYLETL